MRHTRSTPAPRARRWLPRLLRFPVRILSTALVITLVLVFLPRLTRLVGRLWPDPARTERVSEILRHELSQSARLEALTVDDSGVLTATVQAALIGEVQRVTIEYDYHASVGVDLKKAALSVEDGVLVLSLPDFELLSDSLTPTSVDRQDFWYPLTEKRRDQLLSEEREKRAAAALEEARTSEKVRRDTVSSLEQLISSWLGPESWVTTVEVRLAASSGEEGSR